jgi:hypothetical protein
MSPPLTNLQLWLEADVGLYTDTGGTTPVASDGDLVARWNDQSGNGHDFQQATSGNRPAWKTSVLNGKPVARFTNTNSNNLASIASVSHGIGAGDFWLATVIYAPNVPTPPNYTALFSNGGYAPSLNVPHGNHPNIYWGGDHFFSLTMEEITKTQYLIEVARISGTVKLWSTSVGTVPTLDATTYSIATAMANAVLHLGWDTSGSDYYSGDIAEIMLYSASLNSTDQATLENYLRHKYWGVNFGGLIPSNMTANCIDLTGLLNG